MSRRNIFEIPPCPCSFHHHFLARNYTHIPFWPGKREQVIIISIFFDLQKVLGEPWMLSTSQTPIRGEYNCKGDDSLFLNSLEKVLKGSLDYIPSPLPSLKIQIMGKFAWGLKAKHCWTLSTNFWKQKGCWHHPSMFCLVTQVNFPTNHLYFHWRWWDWIQAIYLNIFYFE